MNIWLRCDANATVGFGHFSRCLVLANELKKHQVQCTFLMVSAPLNITGLLNQGEHKLTNIAPSLSIENSSVTKNVNAFTQAITEPNCDLLIVDHYTSDEQWQSLMSPLAKFIMVLNDSGLPLDNADIVWDIALIESMPNPYHQAQHLFLGPQYALISPKFKHGLSETVPKKSTFQLLISIGATDPNNTNLLLVHLIISLNLTVEINILTLSENPNLADLTALKNKHIHVFIDSPNTANIMAKQDLIITAPGNMMWEAFNMGVPCLLIKTCKNQLRNIALINNLLPGIYLGAEQQLETKYIKDTLLKLMTTPSKLSEIKMKIASLCDGMGALRTSEKILKIIQG